MTGPTARLEVAPGRTRTAAARSLDTTREEHPMLTVGDRLPPFRLQAVVSTEKGREFTELTQATFAGRWLVLFSWPMDFTFICPTEIAAFGKRYREFQERDCEVLGMSGD